MKKRAVKIVVTRFEGPIAECDIGHVIEGERVWERATAILKRWGNDGPKDMLGCFKCGFEITFEDGEQYEGRYEAKPGGMTLTEHVVNYCTVHSGRLTNPWMGEKRYRAYLADVVKPEAKKAYEMFLDEYELQDVTASAQESYLESIGAL